MLLTFEKACSLCRTVSHLDEDAVRGCHTSAHHDCCGGSQTQGARAGYDQYSNPKQQSKQEMVVACWQPLLWKPSMSPGHIPAKNSCVSPWEDL